MFLSFVAEYSFMVDSLADEFRVLAHRYLNSVYETEHPVSDSDDSDSSSTASDGSSRERQKQGRRGVPDAKKRGGLMKLAQAFGGAANRSSKPAAASTTATAALSSSKVKLKTEDVWDTPSPDSPEAEMRKRKAVKAKVYSS